MADQGLTIYCHCAYYDLVSAQARADVLDALRSCGARFEVVTDLCLMCARGCEELKDWASEKDLRIIACYPRAVRWLFHRAGAPLAEGVEILNMRTMSPEEVISSLPRGRGPEVGKGLDLDRKDDWVPWFPVIDYDRCANCKQCLDFCLFGVYELDDQGKVEVARPANCKTNCPACARACPQSAIIFPKYGQGPINGDEVPRQTPGLGGTRGNLAEVLSGDIYEGLRKRGKAGKRFSTAGRRDVGPGIEHQCPNLKRLQEELGIGPDVLSSISAEDMMRISRRAAELRQDAEKPGQDESADDD